MSTTLEQLQYGFDRDSRRTWRQRATTQGWDNAYVYDSLSQVIGDDRGDLNLARNAIAGIPSNGSRWQYDETGNWHGYHTQVDGVATLAQSRTHDKGNRLMEVSDAAVMRTDRAGRMLETVPGPANDWNSSYQITWDAWSRIVRVASVEGETVTPEAAYGYDGLTRRITRYTDEEDVTQHSYYNDEWRPVEDRKDSETTASASYLWGSRHRDDLVRRDRAMGGTTLNESRYILMDYFSPASITDEAGDVTERYQFSAFGLRTILNPDFMVRSDSECGMEFSFQGQFEDVETGWLNYGYRYYLPALGRWACKDPIREIGGVNLFATCENNPENNVDHLGLKSGDDCLICLYESHFRSSFSLSHFRWDRGIRGSYLKNQKDSSGPVCGYLGCGANMLNAGQLLSPNGGVPNMPLNNNTANSEHTQDAAKYGIAAIDFQPQGNEAEDLDKAIGAAREKAQELCNKNCCEQVDIEVKCGIKQARNEVDPVLRPGLREVKLWDHGVGR